MQTELNRALDQAAKAENLEEEVKLLQMTTRRAQDEYAEAAKQAAKTRQDEAVVSEEKLAAERVMEKMQTTHASLEQQISRLQDQLRTEKKNSEILAQECAKAERSAAAAALAKTTSDVQLLKMSEQTRQYQRDLSQTMATSGENEMDLQRAISEYQELSQSHDELKAREEKVVEEFERLEIEYTKMQTENSGMRRHIEDDQRDRQHELRTYQERVATAENTVSSLQKDLAISEQNVKKTRLQATELASAKASGELHQLREELGKGMTQWAESEQHRRDQEQTVGKLKSNLLAEKERSTLYKAQVSLLEDQLRAASEELGLLRKFDVYQHTLQREFATARKSRTSDSGSTGGVTSRNIASSPRQPLTSTGIRQQMITSRLDTRLNQSYGAQSPRSYSSDNLQAGKLFASSSDLGQSERPSFLNGVEEKQASPKTTAAIWERIVSTRASAPWTPDEPVLSVDELRSESPSRADLQAAKDMLIEGKKMTGL